MTSCLNEQERAVWKDAYTLHEKMHDMTGKDEEWADALTTLTRMADKYTGETRSLAAMLFMAVYDFMGEHVKALQDAERNKPEQISMEAIPWS